MTKGKPLDLEYVDILRIVQDSTIGDYRKAGEIEKYIKQRIKLAVQGLLQEIEEDIAYWKKVMKEYEEKELNAKTEEERKEYDEYWKIAEQVHRVLNTRIKNLIKKWFPDEVKRKW